MEENTNASFKRGREEEEIEIEIEGEEDLKRQKPYKDIINLLEEDEDDPNEDLSSIISTLLDELSSGAPDPEKPGSLGSVSSSGSEEGEGEGEGEKVMRHLLEASDDELGIPSTDGLDSSAGGSYVDGGDWSLPVGESLWEFEDHEAANYYNLLQSEIFM